MDIHRDSHQVGERMTISPTVQRSDLVNSVCCTKSKLNRDTDYERPRVRSTSHLKFVEMTLDNSGHDFGQLGAQFGDASLVE